MGRYASHAKARHAQHRPHIIGWMDAVSAAHCTKPEVHYCRLEIDVEPDLFLFINVLLIISVTAAHRARFALAEDEGPSA